MTKATISSFKAASKALSPKAKTDIAAEIIIFRVAIVRNAI